MPICSKCRTGFDAELSHCPKCKTAWVTGEKRSESKSLILPYFWTLFLLAIVLQFAYQRCWSYLESKQTSLIALDSRNRQAAWSVPSNLGSDSVGDIINAEKGRVFVSKPLDFDKSIWGYKRYQTDVFDGFSGKRLWTFNPQLSKPSIKYRNTAYNSLYV